MRFPLFYLAVSVATATSAIAQSPPTKSGAKPKAAVQTPERLNQRRPVRRPDYARRIVRSGRPYVCYYYVQPPYYQYYCQPTGRYAGPVYPMGYRYYYNPRGGGSYYRRVGPYYWYYFWR